MTMDYGNALPAGTSMRTGTEQALIATQKQLLAIYRQAGVVMTPQQVWEHMGATPMIGRNDVQGEVFSLGDAHALVSFAKKMHLARVSMWSANRDSQCGVQSIDDQVSNTCSGVPQNPLAFTWELGRLNGKPPVRATAPALPDASQLPTRDNPATSPYPIWLATKAYRLGDEVVWHQRVYEAKWYTTGYAPDTPVAHLWDTPWRYIGPVLKSDAQVATSGAGKLREWSSDQVYLAGTKVLLNGMVYEAKWSTQSDATVERPDPPLGRAVEAARRGDLGPGPAGERADHDDRRHHDGGSGRHQPDPGRERAERGELELDRRGDDEAQQVSDGGGGRASARHHRLQHPDRVPDRLGLDEGAQPPMPGSAVQSARAAASTRLTLSAAARSQGRPIGSARRR